MTRQSRTPYSRFGTVGGGIALIGLAAMAVSCGGGGGGSSGGDPSSSTQTQITSTTAQAAAAEVSAFVPVCSTAGASASGNGSDLLNRAVALAQQRHQARLLSAPDNSKRRALALTSTPPADVLGACGGRYGYSSYNHVNGVTTATLTFSDYCNSDSATGNQEVINGSLSFVNTATPTDGGPISTKFEGSSSGIAVVVKSGTSTIRSETLAFSGLTYTVGVPGGNPTVSNPDRLVISEVKETDNLTGKARRQTGVQMVSYDTASGGSQMTFQARGYRSNGEYFDISTPTPLVTDASGDYTGGTLAFSGAGGSSAMLTLVPGPTLQATLTVNGTVDTTLPACK